MANTGRRNNNKAWTPKYPTVGMMDCMIEGYVQKITEGDGVDYVTFYINNQYVSGNINTVEVSVEWDTLPQLEIGDHVVVAGCIRSFWIKEKSMVQYSFVARDISFVKEEEQPAKKSRRSGQRMVE